MVWKSALSPLVLAAAILFATGRMKAGSRIAACFLIVLFLAAEHGSRLLRGQPLWAGALWTILIAGGLATGVWGTFELASAQRDAARVPPAPQRTDRV